MQFSGLGSKRRFRSKFRFHGSFRSRMDRKQFSRFDLCDSLLSCFSVTMIALQFAQLEKGASKGLCLEFILHEYAKALALDQRLQCANPENQLVILEKLFADPLNSSILVEPGILDKLCFYCEALVQTSKTGENLLGAIDELRNACALPRSVLARQLHAIVSPPIPPQELLQKLHDGLLKFFDQLATVIIQSRECEAALFTLVELRSSLNSFLGENKVDLLLQQLFPDGPHSLRQSINEGFASRGFHDFCDRHEALFEGLAWQQQPEICAKTL
jgi:hypothetical protein